MAQAPTIPISTLTKNMVMTAEITGLRRFRVRFWIATLLFRLGAMIMGVGITITGSDHGD